MGVPVTVWWLSCPGAVCVVVCLILLVIVKSFSSVEKSSKVVQLRCLVLVPLIFVVLFDAVVFVLSVVLLKFAAFVLSELLAVVVPFNVDFVVSVLLVVSTSICVVVGKLVVKVVSDISAGRPTICYIFIV